MCSSSTAVEVRLLQSRCRALAGQVNLSTLRLTEVQDQSAPGTPTLAPVRIGKRGFKFPVPRSRRPNRESGKNRGPGFQVPEKKPWEPGEIGIPSPTRISRRVTSINCHCLPVPLQWARNILSRKYHASALTVTGGSMRLLSRFRAGSERGNMLLSLPLPPRAATAQGSY
jgi:hypothetical protein